MRPRAPTRCGCCDVRPRSRSRPISTEVTAGRYAASAGFRIYRTDGSQVNWEISGGATRKSKTLFAYLLQKGGQGGTTDELCDLLWPEADKVETARNRLYHTVKCLREALQGKPGRGAGRREHLLRDGSRYILVPPERSWLDISTFEQLCRQSHSHIKSGASDEALICLQAADRLYTGDLFEDIPADYADNTEHDWCWSKRYWLRDMFFKVQRDAARIHRERQDFSTALAHCQKALAIDPLCEIAHEEAMRVFRAQGRREAIDRQYKLYRDSLGHFDDRPQSACAASGLSGAGGPKLVLWPINLLILLDFLAKEKPKIELYPLKKKHPQRAHGGDDGDGDGRKGLPLFKRID